MVGLREDRADEGGDGLAGGVRDGRQQVAHEVHAEALPAANHSLRADAVAVRVRGPCRRCLCSPSGSMTTATPCDDPFTVKESIEATERPTCCYALDDCTPIARAVHRSGSPTMAEGT